MSGPYPLFHADFPITLKSYNIIPYKNDYKLSSHISMSLHILKQFHIAWDTYMECPNKSARF